MIIVKQADKRQKQIYKKTADILHIEQHELIKN